MRLRRVHLTDFRNYASADVDLAPDGVTVIQGGNGQGKTNLLEAVGWLAALSSFRGAPPEALVRAGCATAVVRGEGERAGRDVLVEAEIAPAGRNRVLVNHQPLKRAADLPGALQVSLFAPDDLALVKAGPAGRRRWLDDALEALHPRHRAERSDLDRVLRQRNALLKQCRGRLDPSSTSTLDVWDQRLATTGEALAASRAAFVATVEGPVGKAYDQLAGAPAEVGMAYERSWAGTLAEALAAARDDDVRRGLSTVGPHRDELGLVLGGMPARTHASQGEQRCLALSLRLGAHAAVTEAVGEPPVLLLDDVFSELDGERSAALVAHLPDGQALLTTAGSAPAGITPACTLRVHGGRVG